MSPPDTDHSESSKEPASKDHGAEIAGPALPATRRGLRGIFYYLFGIGLLAALMRGAWWLIGGRTTYHLRTEGKGLQIETHRSILARTVHRSERQHRLSDVDFVELGQRFSGWPLWLGAICFAGGILLGGSWIAEAARTGETYILLAGAVVILAGSGADFLMTLWHRHREGHSSVSLRTWDGRTICVGGLTAPQSTAFIQSLGLPQ